MALKLIDTVPNCIDYEAYSGSTGGHYVYNPYLIAAPRQYVESITRMKQFFYDPVGDLYIAYAVLDYAFWPSWRLKRYVWDGEEGVLDTALTTSTGILFSHWTNHISVGGYNKFYATGNSFLDVKEIDWRTETWPGWACYNWAGRNPAAFHQAIVNRIDKLVVGNALGLAFYVYNYDTQALVGQIASLRTTNRGYMCYEDDSRFWVVFSTGQLAKINYQTLKHELLSQVQDPDPADISYRCAFDTNRKRLAILRHKPDASDGACEVQLEFYQPVPQPRFITAPVPVNSLLAGQEVCFAGHVLGDAGEGIAAQEVTAALAAPAEGSLQAGLVHTGANGAFNLVYTGPDDNATETLEVSTEV